MATGGNRCDSEATGCCAGAMTGNGATGADDCPGCVTTLGCTETGAVAVLETTAGGDGRELNRITTIPNNRKTNSVNPPITR